MPHPLPSQGKETGFIKKNVYSYMNAVLAARVRISKKIARFLALRQLMFVNMEGTKNEPKRTGPGEQLFSGL